MSFLAPLFLLGTLAIAGPILLHLIRRTTREQTPFSSLMFLRQTPPRVTRRSRLENLWLLLLRCLAIALLALAFSRPFFQQHIATPPAGAAEKRTVILLDTSASMRREDLWKSAREKVAARLEAAAATDEVALLTFARGTQALMTFDRWRESKPEERAAVALQSLDDAKPGWAGTELGPAVLRAAELLDAGGGAVANAEIVIVSDLQDGAKLDGLQGFAWPKQLRVVLDSVRADTRENASAQWLSESDTTEGIRLRVRSNTAAKDEQFRLQWEPGPPNAGLDVYVPAGQARTARPPARPDGAERLVLTGDDVAFDNTLSILPLAPAQVPVLFVGNDKPDDTQGALFYLRRAFPPTREQTIEIVARPTDAAPAAFELQRAQLLVLGDGITAESIDAAREFAKSGKIAVLPLARPEYSAALAKLLGIEEVPLTEAKGRDYSMLAQIDFTHPLFAPFADPRFSDFTKIHFWKHRLLDATKLPGAKVLARFDDDAPAIIQVPMGSGSVVILATTWRPADSQLALSSKFVPVLHAMLELSSKLPPRRAQYFVGDPIPLPPAPQPFVLKKPDGKEIEVPAGTAFTATDEPGIYTAMPGPLRFVVNLTPEESLLDPLDPARLAALGVPLEIPAGTANAKSAADPSIAKATELESQQKLWRWLIVAALGVLLIETLIAARLSRSTPSHANS